MVERLNGLVMRKSASNQYTQRTVPGTAQVRGFADADADVTVNGNGTWRYPNLGGPAAPTSPQSGATSAAPAAQTSYFYGGEEFLPTECDSARTES